MKRGSSALFNILIECENCLIIQDKELRRHNNKEKKKNRGIITNNNQILLEGMDSHYTLNGDIIISIIIVFMNLNYMATTELLYPYNHDNPIAKILHEYDIKKDGAGPQSRKQTTAPDCAPRPSDGGTR